MRHLDGAQAAAASSSAPVALTLAGPGSGKTSTLTGRFVHLVRQGVDPARILAVTFTKKAANEMADRIARLLQAPSRAGLQVMTFHAFAYRLLKRNANLAGLPERFELWERPQQRRVFTARQMWWNEDKDILDIIEGAKERLLDADGFAAEIDRSDDVLNDAVNYFRVYEQALKEANAIDFTDMVPLVAKAMDRHEFYRRSITQAYEHLLVDEYQDVNPGQIWLIDQLVNDGVKLWAVGDDDQTLYAFRASNVRYILEFTSKYPAARVHVLNRNYRSCATIVLAAKRLIGQNCNRFAKDYYPTIQEAGELVIRGYSAPEIEARQIALAVRDLIQRGCGPHQIAVLYRAGAIGLAFQTALKNLSVPFEVRGGADVWQGVAIKLVVGALYYLRDGPGPEAMSRLGSNKRSHIVREQLEAIRTLVRDQFQASCKAVHRVVRDAIPSQASERERAEWTTVVDAGAALALSCSSLEELETKVAEQSRSLRNPPRNAVVLSTIHSAKGLEWDVVFMVAMEDGVLPHVYSDDLEEERRVAYVGMTRARRGLSLTYSAQRYNEKAVPSPFLFEVSGEDKRLCIWTGPRLKGADGRLPLITPEETRRIAARHHSSAALVSAQPAGRIASTPSRGRHADLLKRC